MDAIGELDRVPEAFFVWIGEEESPGLTTIRGLVEPGQIAFA